jgi:sporulation protein YlmC with PRC-barrel domain
MQALPDASEQAPAGVEKFVEGQGAGQFVSSDLVGRSLYDLEGKEMGVVTDLFVDENKDVSFIVVDVSDVAGSEKKIAFDFDALAYQVNDSEIHLVADLGRDAVERAPSFTSLADAAALGDFQGLTEDADEPQSLDKPATEAP